jgi:hypothetical protein
MTALQQQKLNFTHLIPIHALTQLGTLLLLIVAPCAVFGFFYVWAKLRKGPAKH